MDNRQGDYPQSEAPSASAPYTSTNSSVTPSSDYASARSGSYPDYGVPRNQYPDAGQRYQVSAAQNTPGNMVQSSPSTTPVPDGHPKNHQGPYMEYPSNTAAPVDPSITQSSPTYPHQHAQYPYSHDMQQHPYQTPTHNMYGRPDYGPPHSVPPHYPTPYGHVPGSNMSTPGSMASAQRPPGGGHPLSTVYSFVPIPGTHQQKRPRRRYEEIERMYKCGWQGCEKAYGTLNHLNAHVTMQSHGAKRTPEEFKEIRKEWKQRKKEEESQKKADDDRQRSQSGQSSSAQPDGQPPPSESASTPQSQSGYPPQAGVRQLPPLGYAPASGPGQYGQPGAPMEGMSPQYANGQMGNYYSTQSPYQPNQQM